VLVALESLLPDLERSGVTELDVSSGGARLFVRRRLGPAPATPGAPTAAAPADDEAGLTPIVTPLSGVFYASSGPDEPPYVQVGDVVEAGQVVGLVEAMKVFNEIHAELAGTVERILAASGDLVHAQQTLMQLRPDAAEGEAE
jgi:acetyl-CoA carboxylase biotin carboxyl carrier protein